MRPQDLTAMTARCCPWVVFILCMNWSRGGQCLPMPQMPTLPIASERDIALGTGPAFERWRRESIEMQREHCALLAAPWKETRGGGDRGHQYRLRILSLPEGGPRRAVFPEQTLFGFVRRVYRCCQMGFLCRSIKGIQGQLSADSEVEFLLSPDVLSATVTRAEVHLHISNPLHLRVEPWLATHKRPTRYRVWAGHGKLELMLDLLFLFQGLQEAIGGTRGGSSLVDFRRVGGLARQSGAGLRVGQVGSSPQETDTGLWEGPLPWALELGLVLHCTREGGGEAVPCENNGVHLLYTPFFAISYQ
uniref:Si:ch211-170d8.2 n=1 Tax=Paramormyrops kingsleyae TaxID=1676925 RepID=A0A3B3QV24_9TELE|nr:uncharacterized protein LOC111858736 [Paramormyrops kingsleyae]